MAAVPDPNAGYPPGNPPPYEQYVQTQPIIMQPLGPNVVTTITVNPVGSKPTSLTCKSCGANIVTKVQFIPSIRTHLLALLLCVVGCWPCACVPYCVDTCNNVDHYCPNCNAYLGSFQN